MKQNESQLKNPSNPVTFLTNRYAVMIISDFHNYGADIVHLRNKHFSTVRDIYRRI